MTFTYQDDPLGNLKVTNPYLPSGDTKVTRAPLLLQPPSSAAWHQYVTKGRRGILVSDFDTDILQTPHTRPQNGASKSEPGKGQMKRSLASPLVTVTTCHHVHAPPASCALKVATQFIHKQLLDFDHVLL